MTEEAMEEVMEEEEAEDNSIREAFDSSVSEEQSEDDTKMAMIQAGATFKNVTRLYNQFMIDAGFAISKEDRNQIVNDTLEGCGLDTEEFFDAAVEALVDSVQGATERSAGALIRGYAKKHDLECFTKPKSEGGTRNPFNSLYHAALIENPEFSEQDLRDLIATLKPEHQTNPTRWFNQANLLRTTINKVAAKYKANEY